MKELKKTITKLLYDFENPKRTALSKQFPLLLQPILFTRYITRTIENFFNKNITYKKHSAYFPCIIACHQSLLRRKLGDSNPKLQEQKIQNLQQAITRLNKIIIPSGKIFSLWTILGKPTPKKGYVNGMLLSNGKVLEGIGGGLCQLSNFLFWIFLHTPVEIIERHHHSMDVFPDEKRTLPFGSGATILYNFIDLQIKNISPYPLQLKLWLTDKHLKGQILSPEKIEVKFHLFEKNHYFIKKGTTYFRYNEIWREKKYKGKKINTEKIITNFAPVLYNISEEYIQKNNLNFIKI